MSDTTKKNVKKYETLRGLATYAFVHKPDKGNAEMKIAPSYKIDVCLNTKDELNKAKALGLKIKPADARHEHPFVTIKSKVEEGRNPPRCIDTQRNPIPENILVGNGSEVLVRFLPWGYGKGQVTGLLQEVMVVKLVKYEPTADEMERKGMLPPMEEGFVVGEPVA